MYKIYKELIHLNVKKKTQPNNLIKNWVCTHNKSFQPCPTLATLWIVACQAPLSLGFSRQEHQSGSRALLQGNFLTQGLNSMSVKSSALVGGFFTTSATWEAPKIGQIF